MEHKNSHPRSPTIKELIQEFGDKGEFSKKRIFDFIYNADYEEMQSKINKFSTKIISGNILKKIFSYSFINSHDRHRILTAIGIEVCPYCNRQYITNWTNVEQNSKKTTADLDHFFYKAKYPITTLCLYNFIPSCQICNSRFKLKKDFHLHPHIYPYKEGFDENAKFQFDNFEHFWSDNVNFSICNLYNKEEIRYSIETFRINEVYKSHTDYVKELVKKSIIYKEGQIEEYLSEFEGLFESKEEIRRIIFGNYIDKNDFCKRPLSKLTIDLLEDLGVEL